jgi:type IV pilus assembly protein PilC
MRGHIRGIATTQLACHRPVIFMSTFAYRISRLDGTIVEGQADGHDEGSVRSTLEGQGYLVLELSRSDKTSSITLKLSAGRRKIKSQEFLIFNRELLAMLKAGSRSCRSSTC